MIIRLTLLAVVNFLFYAVTFAESVSRVTERTQAANNRNASEAMRSPMRSAGRNLCYGEIC